MSSDREILSALLCEVSHQSAPFQSLIRDYSADVMNDPEAHRLFTARLDANLPMGRENEILKASLCVPAAGPLSPAMNDVLAAAARNGSRPLAGMRRLRGGRCEGAKP